MSPTSMADPNASAPRIPPVNPASLSPPQRRVYGRIADSRGDVAGAFTVLLHAPELADRVQQLGAYLRYETVLDRDVAETGILATARAMASEFEWDTHEPYARQAGVPGEVIEALRSDEPTATMPDRYAITVAYARALIRSGRVPDDDYAAAVELLGAVATVELTVIVGYYVMLALTLGAHEIPVRAPGAEPTER